MNVLLTCAGRRNYLIQYFREALGGNGQVLAADCNEDAAALQEADLAFTVPPVEEGQYVATLLEICREHRVGLLLSLSDLELPVLAEQRERFAEAGTRVVISSPRVVDICADKWASVEFLRQHGLAAPATFLGLGSVQRALRAGHVRFPLIVKPRWGTASIGICPAEEERELESAYDLLRRQLPRTRLANGCVGNQDDCVLVQERVEGDEHGLDVINDLRGRYVTTFARRKLVMRAGETDRAMTVADEQLDRVGRTLGPALGHIGVLDCDVFVGEKGCVVLEMNPRFGGGYPFSHTAGADIPACLLAWAGGEEADPSWLSPRPNVVASKCDRLVVSKAGAKTEAPVAPEAYAGRA